jgi:plastocyanin
MPTSNHRAAVVATVLFAGLGCLPAAGAPLTETERQAVCAEADERYRSIYGRSPKDEPLAVILMFRDVFCPSHLTVKQGSKLRWVNVDRRTSHSVWFKEADRPESDRIFPEETIDMTVDFPPGDYPYLCGPHWKSEGMIGRLTVIGR